MVQVSEAQRSILRELHERIVGAERTAQVVVDALQTTVNALHEEKNVLMRMIAREHGLAGAEISINAETGVVSLLPAEQTSLPKDEQS